MNGGVAAVVGNPELLMPGRCWRRSWRLGGGPESRFDALSGPQVGFLGPGYRTYTESRSAVYGRVSASSCWLNVRRTTFPDAQIVRGPIRGPRAVSGRDPYSVKFISIVLGLMPRG